MEAGVSDAPCIYRKVRELLTWCGTRTQVGYADVECAESNYFDGRPVCASCLQAAHGARTWLYTATWRLEN
jgi:hypothetical protein